MGFRFVNHALQNARPPTFFLIMNALNGRGYYMRGLMMNKVSKQQLLEIKTDLAKLPRFKNKCYVCHTEKSKKGMTFHHLSYEPGELTYSDFHNPLEYYEYLKYKVRQNPKRFLYVCNTHHQAITRVKRFSPLTRKRLLAAVRMTS